MLRVMCAVAALSGCVGIDAGSGKGGFDPTEPLPPDKVAVVLAHGFGESPDSFAPAIAQAIEADGNAVLLPAVPAVGTVAERAAAMAPQIDEFLAATGAARVHVIAHSMGGLDVRYLISTLGYADRVASLTTIDTPHGGTRIADVALGGNPIDKTLARQAIQAFVGNVDGATLDRALVDLSKAAAPAFAAANPPAPDVIYQSYAGFATRNAGDNPNAPSVCPGTSLPGTLPDALLVTATLASEGSQLPNDGVVWVGSARYGTFRGCLPVDYLSAVGGSARVDIPALYRGIVAELAPPP